jgi:biotin operon repressor
MSIRIDSQETLDNLKRELGATEPANGDNHNGTHPEHLNEEAVFQKLADEYLRAVVTSDNLGDIQIAPRLKIIGEWMKEGDLGFVYGFRGSGKTWLVDLLASGVSSGKAPTDCWEFHSAENVLLIDGEMPYDDFKARLQAFGVNDKLHTLHHEVLFHQNGQSINLTSPRMQRVITRLCDTKKIKLLVLDNLSCLFSGMKENDNDAWEAVLNWLLELRRKRIAVLIVHHAGVNGRMRGASRREDAAFWVIKVEEIKKRSRDEVGARFGTEFEKQRNHASPEWGREWAFLMDSGELSIVCKELSFDEKVLRKIQDGLTSATDIAQELNVAKSTVSKSARKLHSQGLIDIRGRGQYYPQGFMREKMETKSEQSAFPK